MSVMSSLRSRSAIILFAKAPRPGQVKTRLTTLLAPEEAAGLYAAFVVDLGALYAELPVDVRMYVPHPDRLSPGLLPPGATLHRQRGDGLGARMRAAFDETFACGYARVVITGSDHPTLPVRLVMRSFEHLSAPRTVSIGPAEDGGFYLLGMNRLHAGLFEGMTYSHARVFGQTCARAAARGLAVEMLPAWYDIDTPPALRRLVRDLRETKMDLPHTRAAVGRLVERYPSLRHLVAAPPVEETLL